MNLDGSPKFETENDVNMNHLKCVWLGINNGWSYFLVANL